MISTQEMLSDILEATSNDNHKYMSLQEMIQALWQCIEVDEETGEKYLRVKSED